jgi:hypothetical protein
MRGREKKQTVMFSTATIESLVEKKLPVGSSTSEDQRENERSPEGVVSPIRRPLFQNRASFGSAGVLASRNAMDGIILDS